MISHQLGTDIFLDNVFSLHLAPNNNLSPTH